MKTRLLMLTLFLVPCILISQDIGKLSGKVNDKASGEPLAGANVLIEGTSLGAATDSDGEYSILGVPVGTYTMSCNYIGYSTLKTSNVSVSAGLTSQSDFSLVVSTIEGEVIEVVAERPLINRNSTNTLRIIGSETIENIPLRGVESIVALQTGTVSDDGNIYVRGSRAGDVAYYVDGVYMNNAWSLANTSTVSNAAMEEIQFQSGGFSAEYGNVNGGVVNTTTKSGGSEIQISGEMITGMGTKGSGSEDGLYSNGYNLYNINVGGPVTEKIKFYLSYEGRGIDDSNPSSHPSYSMDRTEFDATEVDFLYDEDGEKVKDEHENIFIVDNQGSPDEFLEDGVTTNPDYNASYGMVLDGFDCEGCFFDYHSVSRYDDTGSPDEFLEDGVTANPDYNASFGELTSETVYSGYNNFQNVYGSKTNAGSDRSTITGNLVFDFNPLKLKVGGSLNSNKGRSYNHSYSLVNSDNNPEYENSSLSLYANVTYSISENSFIKLNASSFKYTSESGDVNFGDDFSLYGAVDDDSYLVVPGQNQSSISQTAKFSSYGSVYDDYSYNETSYTGLKVDYINQLDDHELRAGLDYRKNTIKYYRIAQPMEIAWQEYQGSLDAETEMNDDWYYNVYHDAYVDNLGFTVDYTDKENGNHYQAPGEPIIMGAYIQDKIELQDLVVNAGIRFDYFDPNTEAPEDWNNVWLEFGKNRGIDRNPASSYMDFKIDEFNASVGWHDSLGVNDAAIEFWNGALEDTVNTSIRDNYNSRLSGKYDKVNAYSFFSPRIGFSFPVTDQTKFHAQYGKFTQHPVLSNLYLSDTALSADLTQGNATVSGNPSLKPEETTQYEVGFTQQIGISAALDITGFFKEVRNYTMLVNRLDGHVNGNPQVWAQYQNGDFGIVKGLSFNLNMRRVKGIMTNVSYTVSFAEGTGSDAASNFNIAWIGDDNYPTTINPLEYDQRHTGSVMVDYRSDKQSGLFADMGLNLLYQFGSGTAYTPAQIYSVVHDRDWLAPVASINSAYKPWTSTLDLKINKGLKLAGYQATIYLLVNNLLNTNNVDEVYAGSGEAGTDAWLNTSNGKTWVDGHGNGIAYYNAKISDPRNWDAPRQVRLGLTFGL